MTTADKRNRVVEMICSYTTITGHDDASIKKNDLAT